LEQCKEEKQPIKCSNKGHWNNARKKNSQSNVPIQVIGTMQGRKTANPMFQYRSLEQCKDGKQPIQCSNKGHWNNARKKNSQSNVPIRVIGTMQGWKTANPMFQ
jgi:hypothetical protein